MTIRPQDGPEESRKEDAAAENPAEANGHEGGTLSTQDGDQSKVEGHQPNQNEAKSDVPTVEPGEQQGTQNGDQAKVDQPNQAKPAVTQKAENPLVNPLRSELATQNGDQAKVDGGNRQPKQTKHVPDRSKHQVNSPGKSSTEVTISKSQSEPLKNASPSSQNAAKRSQSLSLPERTKEFRCMVVGPQGVGKSTFLRTFWKLDDLSLGEVGESTREIQEFGPFRSPFNDFSVFVIDTPGYGEKMDSQERLWSIENWVEDWIEKKQKEFLRGITPSSIHTIDCCFVFFAPHRDSEVDFELIKILSQFTTIVPILAKADTYTERELKAFQNQLQKSFFDHKIDLFSFENFTFANEEWRVSFRTLGVDDGNLQRTLFMPFSIIG